MSTHQQVRVSLEEAVREAGQSEALARRLVAWVDQLTSGNSRLERKDDVARHVDACLDAVELTTDEWEDA